MDVRQLILEYLRQAQFMHIASSWNNQPWVATVYFSADADLNLYWISRQNTRHSQEIVHNSKVGGAIVLPHTYGQKVRGVQFEGNAKQLEGKDSEMGFVVYSQRYWIVDERAGTNGPGPNTHYCYRVQPSKFVLYDEVNFPDNPYQEMKV